MRIITLNFKMIANDSQDSKCDVLALVGFIHHYGHADPGRSMNESNGPTNTRMSETRIKIFRVSIGSNQLVSHTHLRMCHIICIGIIREASHTLDTCDRGGSRLRNITGCDLVQKVLPQQVVRR